jgi:hypothetical protein
MEVLGLVIIMVAMVVKILVVAVVLMEELEILEHDQEMAEQVALLLRINLTKYHSYDYY